MRNLKPIELLFDFATICMVECSNGHLFWTMKGGRFTSMTNQAVKFRPAQGLRKLTWSQVEQLDQAIHQLCQHSVSEGGVLELTVIIRNGHPRHFKHPLITKELTPIWDP